MPAVLEPDSERNYATVVAEPANADIACVDRELVLELYKAHGAVLFRGFALELAAQEAFTAGFCSGFLLNDSRGRQLISQRAKIQTVDPGGQAFPLHPELSASPLKPEIAWFKCAKAPPRGGETLLCDGVALAAALPPELRASLARRALLYRRRIPAPLLEQLFGDTHPAAAELEAASGEGHWSLDREGEAYFRSYRAPVLHRPMFSECLAFGNFLLFARFGQKLKDYPTFEDGSEIPDSIALEIKRVADGLATAHRWQRNDLLMVDNTRFMHGRNEIEDLGQRIVLSQFGYVGFAPLSAAEREARPWRQGTESEACARSWTCRLAVSL